MTKRRPTNKKPTGVNTALGNSLVNERRKARTSHILTKVRGEAENHAVLQVPKAKPKELKSITAESSLDEFLAKVELAGTDFTADRNDARVVEQNICSIVPTKQEIANNLEMQRSYANRLKIPRRPPKTLWKSGDQLMAVENKHFLNWRKELAELQQVDGLVLTPFERNLELWRQLWRVVERSDVIVQVLDARNPLLFRSVDLEAYVTECDMTKRNVLLVNKADLLTDEQIEMWRQWFKKNQIDAVFWSALEMRSDAIEETEKDQMNPCESEVEEGADDSGIEQAEKTDRPEPVLNFENIPFLKSSDELIKYFKTRVVPSSNATFLNRPFVIGMVGYPNVGKSSTINRILGKKKVSVSATPGKTRHLQTLIIDDELTLCDCPGLVMPSFALNRAEMLLNGILSVDGMGESFTPVGLLASRVPRRCFESTYSIMLPRPAEHEEKTSPPTAHELLTSVAFMRGFMTSSGIPDCSRAARVLIKDVVNGKIKWVAAPPDVLQEDFDKYTYSEFVNIEQEKLGNKGVVSLQQLEKRHLLESTSVKDKVVDQKFFSAGEGVAHIKPLRGMLQNSENKIRLKKGKKEKLRRVYHHLDA